MARDTTDLTPVSSMSELAEHMAEGCKPEEAFRIGTEHEKFVFFKADHAPVPYEGEAGIETILRQLQAKTGWEPIDDAGKIIGLAATSGGGAISLEPGGQFELSGAPLETLHQTCKESNEHLAAVKAIADPLGIGFLGVGGSPKWSLDETPRMPKSRYGIMSRYMPKVGTQGLDMMYRTCTIQVNLDFSSEADMRRKMQVSLKLQPLATALFASSPLPRASRTGCNPGAAISGATRTTSAPACWKPFSRRASALKTMRAGRSTCPCISWCATASITIARTSPSASSWMAR